MATAREESVYEGAAGTGGKFRKKPFRRTTQSTPYDRPPTAFRIPTINNTGNSDGWFAKLVDPAQRLITASAHRLFSSVFRKRLPPSPPAPKPPELEQQNQEQNSAVASREVRDNNQQEVLTDPSKVQGVIGGGDIPSSSSERDGLTELEQVLKQKTFTRSEIDHFTALLLSRTVDTPLEDKEKKSDVIPSKPVVSHIRKEEFLNTPVQENGVESHLISNTAVSSSVLDEDVASPAELAKAYMGSRSTIVSPSMLVLHSPAFREVPTMQNNQPFPSKSPITSLVQRPSSHVGVRNNGFITPRSQGRSAIYTMARTPYSRVHPTTNLKGSGSMIDAYGGPSSSSTFQFSWEKNRPVGLKRRSSVLDNAVVSVGPIRRIRQKPNLLPSKNLRLPVSGGSLSISGAGVSSDAPQYSSSLIQKPLLLGEPKSSSSKMTVENGDNSITGTGFAPVPSKSREMASKILQHLEVLTPKKDKVNAREKSSSPLLPSVLRGQVSRSIENEDSPRPSRDFQGNNDLDGSLDISTPEARDSSQKQKKIEENGPIKYVAPSGRSAPAVNGVEITVSMDGTVPGVRTVDSDMMNSVGYSPVQKKRAFQMSAQEDFVELDDDRYSNGAAPTPLTEGRDKLDTSVVEGTIIAAEPAKVEKPPAVSDVKALASPALKQKTNLGTDLSVHAERSASFTFPAAPSLSMTVQPTPVSTQSTLTSEKAASPKESDAAPPIFNFGDRFTSPKGPIAASPIFSLSFKSDNKVPQFNVASSSSVTSEPSGLKFGAFSEAPESSSSFAAVSVGTTDSVPKFQEPDRPDRKNESAGVLSRTQQNSLSCASASTAGVFSFGNPANSFSLNNGSLASSSSPFSFSSPISTQNSSNSPILTPTTALGTINTTFTTSSSGGSSAIVTTPTITTTIASSSSFSTSAAAPSAPAANIFKFGSSVVPSTTVSPLPATSALVSVETKSKQDPTFGNLTSTPFGGTSSAIANTGSSVFGFSAAIANNQSQSYTFSASSGPMLSAQTQASPAGTVATFTQSTPIQFGSSTTSPSPSFGLAGNTTFSSGSSLFSSSTPAGALFNSGPTFGMSSSAPSSEANSVSSSSGATSSLFASSWQPAKSPVFGSNNSASTSTAFVFGASAASTSATNSAPLVFGSSNGASAPNFSFSSSTVTTSSQAVFSNPNPVFSFNSASSGNNDQMNMEDSMAEDDSSQASTIPVPVFAQQFISPPKSGFVFGSTAPPPFQFGGQQNLVSPQNPAPFQASGSVEFSAGGSFSLGSSGADKSNRRYVKVNKNRQRRK